MQYIGIIAAMDEEVEVIKLRMKNIVTKSLFKIKFVEGTINSTNVVLVKCGVGKVNAARVTQILISNYNLIYIINVGSAGALNSSLEIGDIVVANKLVQHDFDISTFGHKKGYVPGIGNEIKVNQKLINKIRNIKKEFNDSNLIFGTIASGDVFVQDLNMKEKIENDFSADCVEMEGAAIAQVCFMDEIPFLVIRSISDKLNGNNSIDFNIFLEKACSRYAKFIDILLK